MIQTFIHKSDNNNLYLYDDNYRLSMLVHPELEKVYKNKNNANEYYIKKHQYLKNHGFFAKPRYAEFIRLNESWVKENIINTQQIVFEVTDSCNLNCTYCALGELYEGYDKRIGKKINTQYAISLLKYIFDLKPKNKKSKMYISFFGGEALLNFNFIKKIVEISKQLNSEKGIELEYSITTNATLLYKYIDFLFKNKFHLLISLDGNEDNHSYRVFRQNNKNSFNKIIDNLDIIKSNYPEYFASHINFNAVLHNRNSVKEIYEFIYTRYNKIPRIAELNIRNIKYDKKDKFEIMYHSKRESEAEFQKDKSDLSRITHDELLLYKELTDFLKYYSVNFYISNIKALLPFVEKELPTGTCPPFSKKIFLTNQNKLLPCERVNFNYSLGKVDENIEIDIQEITKQYNFYYEHFEKFCQVCYAYRFCGLCMFQIEKLDKMGTEKFVCDRYQNQFFFENKLHRIFSFLEKYPSDFYQILENVIIE